MPHWKRLRDNDYIGAYAFDQEEEITAVIKSVARREITVNGGEKKEEIVVSFEDAKLKPLVLNSTNGKMIAKLYGPMTEDWVAKPITMYASTCQAFGEQVECVRIRPIAGKPKKKAIDDERLNRAISQIKAGKYSREALLDKYELTGEQFAKLEEEAPVMKQLEGDAETTNA